jgi:hypothetical protein
VTQAATAGWYPDPENPTQQRYWDGAAWNQNVAPTSPSDDAPQDLASPESTAQPVVDAPVLQTWKTSVGFSVLGLLLAPPLMTIVAILPMMLFSMLTGASSPQSLSPIMVLIGNALMLVYAVKFYPSYFSGKPRLRSSKLISFANLMFGGLIFGSLWNGNLTKKTKGSSYIVQAVGSGLMCLWFAVSIVGTLLFGAVSSSTGTSGNAAWSAMASTAVAGVEPLQRTADTHSIYTDAETGASFVIPETWSEAPFVDSPKGRKAKFSLPEVGAYVFYGTDDSIGYNMGDLERIREGNPDATVQRASIGGWTTLC